MVTIKCKYYTEEDDIRPFVWENVDINTDLIAVMEKGDDGKTVLHLNGSTFSTNIPFEKRREVLFGEKENDAAIFITRHLTGGLCRS